PAAWQPAAPESTPFLHPGAAARLSDPPGFAGEVHPRVRARFGIEQPGFYFELDLTGLTPPRPIRFVALPRFPAISRDVSFLVTEDVPAAAVADCIRNAREPLLEEARLSEEYRDPAHVPAGKKSMLWSLTYRASDRTLTDEEATSAHQRIVERLRKSLGIEPR